MANAFINSLSNKAFTIAIPYIYISIKNSLSLFHDNCLKLKLINQSYFNISKQYITIIFADLFLIPYSNKIIVLNLLN